MIQSLRRSRDLSPGNPDFNFDHSPTQMTDNFRKIDIDAFDEDVLLESDLVEPDPRDPGQVLADVKGKNSALRGYISK